MSDMAWTINNTALADLGIESAKLTLANQSADTLDLSVGEDIAAYSSFALGDTLTLRKNSTIVFVGTVISCPREGSSSAHFHRYIVAGPWHDWEHTIYQQTRKVPTVPIDYTAGDIVQENIVTPHVRLGCDPDDLADKWDSGDMIEDAVHYSGGSTGTIGVNEPIPIEESAAITVAEVIRKMLQWTPDAVAYFVYSSGVPVFHVKRSSALSTQSIALGAADSASIAQRQDKRVPGVKLIFRKPFSSDGIESIENHVDTAGSHGDAGALVMTLDIAGSVRAFRSHTVVLDTPAPTSLPWWTVRAPWLADVGEIDAVSIGPYFGGRGGDIGNEIRSGKFPEWMLSNPVSGPIAAQTRVLGEVTHNVTVPDPGAAEARAKFAFIYTDPENISWRHDDYTISHRMAVTEIAAGRYVQQIHYNPGEPVPTGLAAAVYAAANFAPWQGAANRIETDITPASVGVKVNITGGLGAWASMNALVSSVTMDIATGTTAWTFGAPGYLGPGALLQRLRLTRKRRATTTTPVPRDEPGSEIPEPAPPAPAPPGPGPDPEGAATGAPLEPVAIPETNDVRVFFGFVGMEIPAGMTEGDPEGSEYILSGLSGSGVIWAETSYDASTGEQSSAAVGNGASLPAETATREIFPLGSYNVAGGIVTVGGAHGGGNLQWRACPMPFSNPAAYSGELHT